MAKYALRTALLTSLCALLVPAAAGAQTDAGVATPDAPHGAADAAVAEQDEGDDRDGDAVHHDGESEHADAEHAVASPDDGHHPHVEAERVESDSSDAVRVPPPGGSAADLAHPATPPSPTPTPPSPTPSATGTPSAAPVTAVVAGIPIRVTGILHAAVYGSQGVESFGNPTTVAPTSALNPALLGAHADDPELSFQVQQSRFGLSIGEGTPFRAVVEVDFVHFDQSSPTAQAFPRIRIMQLEWHFDANNRLFVGQGWDIFGNAIGPQLLSHSSNLVGTMFQAGNIGFMRHQLGWEGRFGDIAIALAVGMQGSNTGPTFNNLEESATPTGSARVMYYVNPTSVVGISGIGTAERFTNGAADERRLALGGELFADMTFGPVVIHAEAYIAQNLANTGALNLGQGRFGHDVADAGGYASGRLNLGEWSVTAMYGFAGVLRPSEVVPGYTSAAQQFNLTRVGNLAGTGTANTAAGPGMEWNMSGHVGVWFAPMHGLSFVLEPYFYYTRFVLDGTQGLSMAGMNVGVPDTQAFSRERLAVGAQFVTMFQF